MMDWNESYCTELNTLNSNLELILLTDDFIWRNFHSFFKSNILQILKSDLVWYFQMLKTNLWCCHNIAARQLVLMSDISKIRINNLMVPNFVIKIDHTLLHKEFQTSNCSSKFEHSHWWFSKDLGGGRGTLNVTWRGGTHFLRISRTRLGKKICISIPSFGIIRLQKIPKQ